MPFLQPLIKDIGHFKSGWQGPTGSGKTTTAALVAIGIHRHFKLTTPVAFYDSERGSGFVHDLFKYAKIEIVGVRSRSFKDLQKFMEETIREKIDIDIIDSVTHPWRELTEAYKDRRKRTFIDVRDWGPIKSEWHRGFTMPYVNSKMHILMCGRLANVFEDVEEDEDENVKKKFKAVKVGTKMATEGETGYEPNFLVQMDRVLKQEGGRYARIATVIKDRSFRLDGTEHEFEMPMKKDGTPDLERLVEENDPFKFVFPHIESLDPAAGLVAVGVSLSNSQEMFNTEGQNQWARDEQERELLLGNIETLLHKYFPTRDKLSLKAKGDIIEGVSWALGQRVRNWEFIQKKFKLDLVKVFYSAVDLMLTPDHRKMLDEALQMGLGEKDEILNPDAAPDMVRTVCLDLMDRQAKATGINTETKDDLPF